MKKIKKPEDITNIIQEAKIAVAKRNGFIPLIKDEWTFAMLVTHRTKKQIALYEEVLIEIFANIYKK